MQKIKLTQGKYAIVDNAVFDYFNQKRWYFSHGYARREENGKKIYLHRLVNNTPRGFITDHINRNKLDNRKVNLRTVVKKENVRNHKLLKNNSSGFNGISWNKAMNKWEVSIWKNNKKINLGYFKNIHSAYKRRKRGEKEVWND